MLGSQTAEKNLSRTCPYKLRTSSGSGDAVLTNEKLQRVASRGREVAIWLQTPFRGFKHLSGRLEA